MMLVVFVWVILMLFRGEAQVIFPRTPAPSPDGQQIAFSFQGDIWLVPATGGEARRLTGNPAYDYLPHWSPDGKRLAFSSNRYGNFDVFVLDFEERRVRQLTYFTNSDYVSGWTPDGRSILFASRRNFYYHRLPVTYQVPIEGGTPVEFVPEYASQGRVSPDGRYFVFVRGLTTWWRKHYRGSSNTDIWLYDRKKKTYHRLTDFDGNDLFPMWGPDGQTIYFVSESDGTYNLWKMQRDGSGKTQLTFFKGDGVRFPGIAANGSLIAFEKDFDLWTLDPNSGAVQKLNIQLPIDFVTNPVAYRDYSGDATEFVLSPDGKQIAFTVRGEVLVMKENGHFLNALTETPWREGDLVWSPGGDSLVYISDEAGQRDVYLITSNDPQEPLLARATRFTRIRLTNTPDEEFMPQFSPDGKYLAFLRGKGDLILHDLKTGQERVLVRSWNELHYQWSPDGRWIAYSRFDREYNRDVYIINVQTGEQVNVSMHPDDDDHPRWSPDGTRLAFISRRTTDNNYDIWFVYLTRAGFEMSDEEWDDYFQARKEKKGKKAGKKPAVKVQIDMEDIHKRIRRVTRLPGVEGDFTWSPDGQYLVFRSNTAGKADLWKIKWNGKELKQLTRGGQSPSQIIWHAGRKQIYYLRKGGKISVIKPNGQDNKIRSFRARIRIDRPAEQRQKFLEAWMALNDYFYDPNFHGVDWAAMKEKYGPIAEQVYTTEDFNDVVRLMLGELNSSHLGISGPWATQQVQSGMLGLRFDPEYRGEGLKIAEVLPNGPCDRTGNRAQVGEILVAINGQKIEPTTNIHQLLWNRVNQFVELTLKQDRPGEEILRTIRVKPVPFNRFLDLEYDRWVNEKRKKVHQWSQGRLGYIHIRAMGASSLERFEAELYAEAHDKEALVIDVRNNGGGWTTDFLLAMLMVRNHAITIPRDGEKGYPQSRRPLYAWTKPIIVLCNEYSFSNAEIFSHAIKTLGRGKLVGKPTGGFVISTGGIRLIDGSTFRVPYRGWYVIGNRVNMENNGAVPDIIVEDLPGDVVAGVDRQLKRAVEELLKSLDAGK
ncbi:MAG: peptidase S41 [Calditrichaeota bacterium]|nr:peptidase S41 [Calditrichota bacterium]